jgi:hypothetical protein
MEKKRKIESAADATTCGDPFRETFAATYMYMPPLT